MSRRGFMLIYVVLLVSVILISAAFIAKLVISNLSMSHHEIYRVKAFWAAEAGIEWAKTKLAQNPSWYTDPAHAPEDDTDWLVAGAIGQKMQISDEGFKIVRSEGRPVIYSVGYCGDAAAGARSVAIIKVRFTNPPFVQISWERI